MMHDGERMMAKRARVRATRRGTKRRAAKPRHEEDLRNVAAKAARLFYQDRRSREEIRRELELRSVSQVSRLLKLAAEKGILRFVIETPADEAQWELDQELSDKLQDTFGLRCARVVTNPPGWHYDQSKDNDLHRQLARAAAEWLRATVRDNETLLTVGGRTPYHIALSLNDGPWMNVRGVRVVPVTGAIGARTWQPFGLVARVDADDAAFQFARALVRGSDESQRPVPITINLSGALDAGQQQKIHEAREWIRKQLRGEKGQEPEELKLPASIAICGVGRLAGGHRLVQAMEEERAHPSLSVFSPLRPILDKVDQLAGEELRAKGESNWGDLANRLFALFEPEALSPEQRCLLEEINNLVVGISLTELSEVPTVLLCAGGQVKYQAVKHVLRFGRPHSKLRLVRVLVTDSETADRLVSDGAANEDLIDVTELPGAA